MDDNFNSIEDQQKSRVFSYKKLYQNLFVEGSNLLKLEKDELQEFIYENYRDFIELQGEYDEFFKEFGEIKANFSQFENSLKYIFENVNEVKQKKLMMMKKKIQQQKSDSDSDDSDKESEDDDENEEEIKKQDFYKNDIQSDDEEDNNYSQFQNQQKSKKEKEEMVEQINEFLDNISINTFEKNYSQAIQALEVLQNMKKSEKYSHYLNQFDLRRTLETHYQTLVDSIVNDLVSENPLTKTTDLVQFLSAIKQTARAAQGFLEIKKRNLAQLINTKIAQFGKIEGDNTIQLTEEFASFILVVHHEFTALFLRNNENQQLKSFIANWINQSCSVFFYCIQQNVFWGSELEDILENIKLISDVLYQKEEKNMSLNFIIQRLFIEELEYKMDEMFVAYAQRLSRMQNVDDWQIYSMFTVLNVNFCEEEIGNTNLEPIKFISEIDVQEVKRGILSNAKAVKDAVKDINLENGYKKYLIETNLKGARHSILFWNTIFQLIDRVVQNIDIDSRRIFSSQLIALVENKIQLFISEYISSFKEVLQNVANFSENQMLVACANINTCLQFTKFAKRYEATKLSPHIKLDHEAWENEWKKQINIVYNTCYDLLFSYFKYKLLNHIPRLFSDYRKIYTAQSDKELGKAPSPLFIKIAFLLENIKDNLSLIMSQNDIVFYMNQLMHALNYMIEYVIYWDYHWNQKGQNVFFFNQKQVNRLGMNMDQINVYLSQNAVEIGYFQKENMKQFIFDMHFLAILYNGYLCKESKPESKINNADFLNKALACFCKRKGYNAKDFQFQYQDYRQNLMDYCTKEFKTDINAIIMKERESALKQSMSNTQQSINSIGQSNSLSQSLQKRPSIKERIFAINLAMQNNY